MTENNDPLKNLEPKTLEAIKKMEGTASLEELNKINLQYSVGKNSFISLATQSLSKIDPEQRKEYGRQLNASKVMLEKANLENQKRHYLKTDESKEWFDVSLPVKKTRVGHLSPDRKIIRKMNEFFIYHGYSVAEGPDIETDEFNFEKTNLPKDHPARDLQDTIYIESPEILLRTHTSSVETRILSSRKPPLRFVVPGASFRNEIINLSNHAIFYQYQGVVVDKGISLANLKATLEEFAKHMYGSEVKTRFRTKYYPEVEPGAGMDILCSFCQGGGCRICKGRGWLEILGSGMIHPNLLNKCGINSREWSGFAFGMGLDRIIMSKFNITDIRDLHSGNLVFN